MATPQEAQNKPTPSPKERVASAMGELAALGAEKLRTTANNVHQLSYNSGKVRVTRAHLHKVQRFLLALADTVDEPAKGGDPS